MFGCVICTYKRPKYLKTFFESLIRVEDLQEIEFIIIDDFSQSRAIHSLIQEYKKYFEKVTVIYKEINTGVFSSLILGWDILFKKSDIKFLMNLDTDLIFKKNWFLQLKKLNKNSEGKHLLTGFSIDKFQTVVEGKDFREKYHTGGVNLLFNKNYYPEMRKFLVREENYSYLTEKDKNKKLTLSNDYLETSHWDWVLSYYCLEKGIKKWSTKPCTVEHIGKKGLTSTPFSYDKAEDFYD